MNEGKDERGLVMSNQRDFDLHKFVFEIDRAIRTQVIEKLEASPELPL